MYTNILHPTDLSKNHFHLSQKAAEIAKCFNANLYLIHVIEPPKILQLAQGLGFAEFDKPVKDDAIAVMSVLGEALEVPAERQFVEIGSIKVHVLEKANEIACDLIIMGSHSPSNIPTFLGSTAHAVIHHAKCDVLTLLADGTVSA
ncbi:universal stress protein [Legionella londiniensis]|uniref:universal stress protein n=1 Tax=Legionella londiniensis TaxID=45068 RepID=UPI00073074F6|nr:universal stress protein [Legionella londiniensis]STX93108.1 universal stress protein A [Legionella londiniensis]